MNLTKKEKEVLNLLVLDCLTEKEIAEKLCVSRITARTHINNIYLKYGIWGDRSKNNRALLTNMFFTSSFLEQ